MNNIFLAVQKDNAGLQNRVEGLEKVRRDNENMIRWLHQHVRLKKIYLPKITNRYYIIIILVLVLEELFQENIFFMHRNSLLKYNNII